MKRKYLYNRITNVSQRVLSKKKKIKYNVLGDWLYARWIITQLNYLIIQLAQKSHSTHDPVRLRLVRRQAHIHYKVGWVSCGGECSTSLACLVHRGNIVWSVYNTLLLAGLQPHHRHVIVQNFRVRLAYHFFLSVPAGTFHEQAIHVHSVLRWGVVCLVFKNLEVEGQQINGNGVFSCIVLLWTSQESLGEEKSRHPKHGRCAIIIPFLKEFQSGYEVINIAAERLEWWVRLLHPQAWDFSFQNATHDLL